MEKTTITKVTLDEAIELYNSHNKTLKELALKCFSENELKWWNDYGITIELLKKYNIYSCKYVFLNNSIVMLRG